MGAAEPVRDPSRVTTPRRTLAVQLRDQIRDLVVAEGLNPGDKLPSENDLIARFGVGRTTVREALKLLEQDGVVQTRQGDGRYLTAQPGLDRPLTRLEGVTEMLASRDLAVHNTVLDIALIEPDEEQRRQLRLAAGEALVRLERRRQHRDDALLYSIDLFPRSLVPQPLSEVDWTGSLFALLSDHGHPVAYALTQVRAVTLDRKLARRLGQPATVAWLLLAQTHHDSAGRPLLYSEDYHRGTDFSFHLVRRRD